MPPTYEVNWTQLIHAEIIAVTSAMRKNSRWSNLNVSGLSGNLGVSMGLRGIHSRPSRKDGEYRNQESPLMQGFTNLRTYLATISDISELDSSLLLQPFLDVIRSGDTTGPITGAALTSVERFLQYGIVSANSLNLSAAMANVSSAATHCKFEASDSVSDEVVLLKILQVLQITLVSECGSVLSDESVCEMMETGLSMCCQMRLSEMLRRSAEHVMIQMVQAMFERLKSLDDDEIIDNSTGFDSSKPFALPENQFHMNTPTSTQTEPNTKITGPSGESTSSLLSADYGVIEKAQDGSIESIDLPIAVLSTPEASSTPVKEKTIEIISRPYGLPALRELLRVLISLLNPHDHQHTDSMRLMALSILNVAFEVGGQSISRHASLRAMVVDNFCKYLFQLARTDVIPLLTLTLRVICTVFDTMRPYLKLQQELFLQFLIERLTPPNTTNIMPFDIDSNGNITFLAPTLDLSEPNGRSASPSPSNSSRDRSSRGANELVSGEVRELLLECLGQLMRNPTFMVDLWVNYDCNIDCGDLFEDIVKFLAKNSFPEPNSYSASNAHTLCFDALLMFVSHMVNHVGKDNYSEKEAVDEKENVDTSVYSEDIGDLLPPSELMARKDQKRLLLDGAAKFNESPKIGIKFLQDHNILKDNDSEDSNITLAQFLKSTPRLDKKILGDYLSRPANIELLKAFMKKFDFSGKRVDEALRDVLETFRLPGESQQIARIVETFADEYVFSEPKEVSTRDAAYVLSYSIIMLNTDQHNPQVRRRMTMEDYMKNLKGVNDNKDFDTEYLRAIYDAIRKHEIIMPEEHEGQLGFNYAWKEMLRRAETAGSFIICNNEFYDKDIFVMAWKPTVAAISYAFNTAQDDSTLQKAITGFHHCAMLAAHHQLYNVFDSIVISLSKITGLLEVRSNESSSPDPIVEVAGQKYMVTDLAVQFGRNYKGQLAAVVVFAVASEHGNILRQGWKNMLTMIKNLFVNSLLPSSMLQVQDFLAGTTTIPLKPKSTPQVKPESRRDGSSLLSTLSSYLLSPYSGNDSYRADPTEEEVESTMCAVDCVGACRLEELFADITSLEEEPLGALMDAIRFVTSEETSKPKPSSQDDTIQSSTIPYDPAVVFFLELAISITIQNQDRIQFLWPAVFEQIAKILKDSKNQSVILTERAVVGLLRLCIQLANKEDMIDELYRCLDLLLDLPAEVLNSVAEQMMAGVLNLVKMDSAFLNHSRQSADWQKIFALLSIAATHSEASKYSFEASVAIIEENKGSNIQENSFAGAVDLLSKFAFAAGVVGGDVDGKGPNQRATRGRMTKFQATSIDRARKSIEIIYGLYERVPILIEQTNASSSEAWSKFWFPMIWALEQQCYNVNREVRQHALTYLQRALMLPELENEDLEEWVNVFERILFPLLAKLLTPEIFQLDPHGMDETRMRASALLCKIFLHCFSKFVQWEGLIDLWMQILGFLDKYANTGESDHLTESVPESLKNMLLVMYTSGAFNEPGQFTSDGEPVHNELWDVTWERVGLFMPQLRSELFPPNSASESSKTPPPPPPPPPPPASAEDDIKPQENP